MYVFLCAPRCVCLCLLCVYLWVCFSVCFFSVKLGCSIGLNLPDRHWHLNSSKVINSPVSLCRKDTTKHMKMDMATCTNIPMNKDKQIHTNTRQLRMIIKKLCAFCTKPSKTHEVLISLKTHFYSTDVIDIWREGVTYWPNIVLSIVRKKMIHFKIINLCSVLGHPL